MKFRSRVKVVVVVVVRTGLRASLPRVERARVRMLVAARMVLPLRVSLSHSWPLSICSRLRHETSIPTRVVDLLLVLCGAKTLKSANRVILTRFTSVHTAVRSESQQDL